MQQIVKCFGRFFAVCLPPHELVQIKNLKKCIVANLGIMSHIMVIMPHRVKLMPDSCSATPKTHREFFIRKIIFLGGTAIGKEYQKKLTGKKRMIFYSTRHDVIDPNRSYPDMTNI